MLSAGWLVYALTTGALVAVACGIVETLCRHHRLATRWVWAAGLAALLGLTGRAMVIAHGDAETATIVPTPSAPPTLVTRPGAIDAITRLRTIAASTGAAMQAGMIALARALPAVAGPIALLAWLTASMLALVVIAGVHLRVLVLRRRWPRTTLHGHDVRIATSVGPAVLGLARPFIVIPRWLLARSSAEQRLVLAHEREHVRARDHLLLAGASLAAALVPWHPAGWLLWRRMRLAIELDCDARVLQRGIPAQAYGSLLIDLAGQCSGFAVGATALADEASHLERRLLAMTRPASRPSRFRLGALAAAGALAILAACEAKVPTSAEIQTMDVAGAERSAASVHLVDEMNSPNTIFYVDGVKTDAATAHAIDHTRIGSIEVRKINGQSEIRIATLGTPRPVNAAVRTRTVRVEVSGTGTDSTVARDIEIVGRQPGALDTRSFTGLLFIDGQRAESSRLASIPPAEIVSIDVIKGPMATHQSSDPAAANGIIRVTTKAGMAAAKP
jgi:beta-lactamase regulating signal transducer with metallopeptidase domain